MMKLSLFKCFFVSIWFLLRHIVLFLILNSVLYYIFDNFLYNLLVNNFSITLNRFINSNYILAENIFMYLCISLRIILTSSFYIIAMNNDIKDIKNDLFLYISDFLNALFYIITTGLTFLFLALFSAIGVVTLIVFANLCVFCMVYATIRETENGKKCNTIDSISESFKLTKTFRTKLIIFNTPILILVFLFNYFLPNEMYINGFNISIILKALINNLLIIYLSRVCFDMIKIQNIRFEEIKEKEIQNKYNSIRGRSTI